MLYFHQVGVAHHTLISLGQSITERSELVSIGSRTNKIACPRAADSPCKIGFGFIEGHWDFSNWEGRGLRPLVSLQCITSRNPCERRVCCHGEIGRASGRERVEGGGGGGGVKG